MKNPFRAVYLASILAPLLMLQLAGAVGAQTLIGKNIDSRFMLAFAADTGQIQPFLPVGWTSVPFPNGPLTGANLLLGLEDRLLALTPDGKPASPPKSRAAAVLALGKGEDGVRLFVLRVLTSDAGYDLFPEGVPAEVTRSTRSQPGDAKVQRQREEWSFVPGTGGKLDIALDFAVGTGNWASSETRLYSSTDPDLYKILKYDQLVDLVMSRSLGKPLDGEFALSATVSGISGLFDGSEELVGILNIPVYVRDVFAP